MSETNEASVQSVVHTPGPWKRYEGYGVDFRRPVITDAIPDRDGKCVANCICYVATTNDNWDGNAKLIAAAPMMLAALRRIVQHQDIIGGSMASISSTRHIAAQAIQHATGEQV